MKVVALWRAPVKSLQGEALTTASITGRGLLGDRHWALLDADSGRYLTARRQPNLLFGFATADGDRSVTLRVPEQPAVTVPTGDTEAQRRAGAALSAWLGHPVALVEASDDVAGRYETPTDAETEQDWITWTGPTGRFHDSTRTAVSIVTTGTLGPFHPRRFRANIVLDGADGEEDALVGHTIRIGHAELEVTKTIGRCVMVTRAQPDGLGRDLEVLRTINRRRASQLAVGSLVTGEGTVGLGDRVEIVD